MEFSFKPVAFFRSAEQESYQAPFQTGIVPALSGRIVFEAGQNFEQALQDVAGFERLWLLFVFDRSRGWKNKVMPPRGGTKRGLYATRSPHRPNPIGLTCVRLLKVEKRSLWIEDHDLLDGTPILDIKPYLPFADAHPEAAVGWMEDLQEEVFSLRWQPLAWRQYLFLKSAGMDLLPLIQTPLQLNPRPAANNRIKEVQEGMVLACKTWRLAFTVSEEAKEVVIESLASGYDAATLAGEKSSRWDDVPLHQRFNACDWNA